MLTKEAGEGDGGVFLKGCTARLSGWDLIMSRIGTREGAGMMVLQKHVFKTFGKIMIVFNLDLLHVTGFPCFMEQCYN